MQVDLQSPSQSLSLSLGLGDDTPDMLSTFCENYLYLSEGFLEIEQGCYLMILSCALMDKQVKTMLYIYNMALFSHKITKSHGEN